MEWNFVVLIVYSFILVHISSTSGKFIDIDIDSGYDDGKERWLSDEEVRKGVTMHVHAQHYASANTRLSLNVFTFSKFDDEPAFTFIPNFVLH